MILIHIGDSHSDDEDEITRRKLPHQLMKRKRNCSVHEAMKQCGK